MSREVADLLRRAKDRISDPARWTTRVGARNAVGQHVDVLSSNAVCWCALGAIAAVEGSSQTAGFDSATDVLMDVIGDRVSRFNDSHTHAEVMAKFDEAIELAEAAE